MGFAFKSTIVLMVALLPLPAASITLTNRDANERKLTIVEGDKQSERTIKPGEKIETCPQSCVIKLGDGEDYEFDGTEIVSLEDGLLFLDGPDEQPKATR